MVFLFLAVCFFSAVYFYTAERFCLAVCPTAAAGCVSSAAGYVN